MRYEINSTFTRNILLEDILPDGTKILNTNLYGDQGAFIASVLFIDDSNKVVKQLRFESQPLPLRDFTEAQWNEFDKMLEEKAKSFESQATGLGEFPNIIKL